MAAPKSALPPRAIYYGWWVVTACAVGEMLVIGTANYGAGLFVRPLEQEFGLSRADANVAVSMVHLGAALASPFVGYLLDRTSVRLIMGAGAVLMSAGFILISVTSSLLVMGFSAFILLALGFAALGPLAATTNVSRWFYRHRGRAMGLAAMATSLGGIVVVPYLSAAVESFGWRGAMLLQGIIIGISMTLLAALVIKDRPSDAGLQDHPENQGRPQRELAGSGTQHTPSRNFSEYKAIFANPNFWFIVVAVAIISGVLQGLVVTFVPYATGSGFTPGRAALLISLLSTVALITKLASGILADYLDRRIILSVSGGFVAAAAGLLLLGREYEIFLAAALCAGLALGGLLPSFGSLIAECFGSVRFGRVMGLVLVFTQCTQIGSVRFIGSVFDRAGHYDSGLVVFVFISLVGSLAALMVRPERAAKAAASDEPNA
jgi:sugar phosphate permease